MELTIFKERENSTKKIIFSGSTVADLLQQLKINRETVIIIRQQEVLIESEPLDNGDHIKILSMISGG